MAAKTTKQLERLGSKYHKLRQDSKDTRDRLDEVIRDAREEGLTYREIAEAIDLSIAWVQAAVKRIDPDASAA